MSRECEYCFGHEVLEDESGDNHLCWENDGTLYVYTDEYMGHNQTYKINFCPMCGRELRVNADD